MAREIKQINFQDLKQQVEDGWKREQIAEHWDLSIAATKRLLTDAGLRLKSTRYPVYTLVGMEEESAPEVAQVAEETSDLLEQNVETVEEVVEEVSEGMPSLIEAVTDPNGW